MMMDDGGDDDYYYCEKEQEVRYKQSLYYTWQRPIRNTGEMDSWIKYK